MKKIKIPKSFTVEAGLWGAVAQIAAYNTYGTENIPPRNPFAFYRERLKGLAKEKGAEIFKKFNRGRDASADKDKIGIIAASILKEAITDIKDPPNAPATIKGKGFDDPLVDTGLMRSLVTWKTEDHG